MDPTTAPLPAAAPAARRLTGILRSISPRGFGFISTGRGLPQYFVHCTDLPDEAWVEGSVIEFLPAPPRPGSKAARIADPKFISSPLPNRTAPEVAP